MGHTNRGNVPGALWVAIVALSVMALMQVYVGIARGAPVVFVGAAIDAVLVVGLYLGQKWAYILALVFITLGVVVTWAMKGLGPASAQLAFQCLVLVPVLVCTRYFFPSTTGIGVATEEDVGTSGGEGDQ
ncbi:MAG: hypothetical protein JXQ73_17275 [Phycisphaerae bacterium]|nr:hypothetical protein [Phycisphaerae bacterium]